MKIPFNIPYLSGNEAGYINEALNNCRNSEYKNYSERCMGLIKSRLGFKDMFFTQSCTAALEVCALLLDLKSGDEIILPSYTFPSTVNAFLRQGATIVFADSRKDHPGIDENGIETLITEKTKAIVPVHYAGVACNMDLLMEIAKKHELLVIEDAALAIDSKFRTKSLGGVGHLGCLSFHQSKNLQCGEGGAIIINDNRFIDHALSILEKGTNRSEFLTGKVKRYEWVGIGSSFRMTELHSAYLFAQLEKADWIKEKRISLWNLYYSSLKILEEKGIAMLPFIPDYAYHNAHTFYIVLNNQIIMNDLMSFLKINGIEPTVHYTALDQSIFWKNFNSSPGKNINSLKYNDCLIRLPLYNSMSEDQVRSVISSILSFFNV